MRINSGESSWRTACDLYRHTVSMKTFLYFPNSGHLRGSTVDRVCQVGCLGSYLLPNTLWIESSMGVLYFIFVFFFLSDLQSDLVVMLWICMSLYLCDGGGNFFTCKSSNLNVSPKGRRSESSVCGGFEFVVHTSQRNARATIPIPDGNVNFPVCVVLFRQCLPCAEGLSKKDVQTLGVQSNYLLMNTHSRQIHLKNW